MNPSSTPPPTDEDSDWIFIGEVVADRYRIDRLLGEGGMGVVYAARHVLLERDVAVKFLAPALADDPIVVERFLLEARASGKLRHKNIVEVLDCGADRARFFLVMEFLHGETLQSFMDRAGAIDPPRALEIMLPVLDALAFVHSKGFLHRDIKPDNIFLAREGDVVTPRILDFGIARCVDDSRVRLTLPGGTLGTPAYMAPEQALGRKDLTASVDQFAAGVVLYEMLSTRLPQRMKHNLAESIAERATQPMIPLDQAREGLPAGLVDVVMRALSNDASARFPSVAAFREALTPFASSAPAAVVPEAPPTPVEAPAPPARDLRPVAWVAGVSAVVCVAVVSLALALQPPRARPTPPRPVPVAQPTPPAPPAPSTTESDATVSAPVNVSPDAGSSQPAAPTRRRSGRHRRRHDNDTTEGDGSDLRAR